MSADVSRDVVLITVGNWGYRDMIMSWWLNIQHYTPCILDKVYPFLENPLTYPLSKQKSISILIHPKEQTVYFPTGVTL